MSPLSHPDWLHALIRGSVERFDELASKVAETDAGAGALARIVAKGWVRQSMRDRGLSFGAPLPHADDDPGAEGHDEAEGAARTTFRHQADLALEVAAIHGRAGDDPALVAEIVLLFAVLAGELDLARGLEAALTSGRKVPVKAAARAVGAKLAERAAEAGAGPPWIRGSVIADESLRFAGLAIDLHDRRLRLDRTRDSIDDLDEQEAMALIEAIAGVALADEQVTPTEQRLINHRIELSGLSVGARKRLRQRLAAPRPVDQIAADVQDPHHRRFVLEQVLLASHADGFVEAREAAYAAALGRALGFDEATLTQVEASVAEFYGRHQEFLDLSPTGGAMGRMFDRVTARVTELVRVNSDRIIREVRETGELSKLLLKASRGDGLSADERRRVNAQLIDICKTIPALAIFALPGGGILLPVLIKVLPFNILPSAFVEPGGVGTASPE